MQGEDPLARAHCSSQGFGVNVTYGWINTKQFPWSTVEVTRLSLELLLDVNVCVLFLVIPITAS